MARKFKAQNGYTAQQVERAYKTWSSMKYRCKDASNPYYGGKNITYCERWESFDAFFEDMGGRDKGYSLDRIDPNDNYYKENCRWATVGTQARNRTNNVTVTFRGVEFEIATLFSENAFISHNAYTNQLKYDVFFHRITRLNWGVIKAASTPLIPNDKKKLTLMAERRGLTNVIVWNRLYSGWSLRQALRTPLNARQKFSRNELARQNNMPPKLVKQRCTLGWSLERALSTPNQHEDSLAQKAKAHNLPPYIVQRRVRSGWSLEKALSTPVRKKQKHKK